MLRLSGGQVESLWDEVLPGEVQVLPEDLAALDMLLRDPGLLAPIASDWRQEAMSQGRPSIPMEVYVRLMIVKQRTGWGYETLVREVSDSLHLRRFCLIALGERVPHESTVRRLTRRGAAVAAELTRRVIAKAQRETRFKARAVRIDSTVAEADVRYPSDTAPSLDAARTLARQAREPGRADRPRRAGRSTDQAANRGQADLRATGVDVRPRCPSDPQGQARQAQRVRIRHPDLRGHAEHQARRAGFILPASTKLGNPPESKLLPDTASELQRLGLRPKEVALDGAFEQRPTAEALHELSPERVFIAGRQQPGSRRTQRRLGRYRTGAEGRISHLKRGYGLRRSRLKGEAKMRAWAAWAILAYNLDTLAIRTS